MKDYKTLPIYKESADLLKEVAYVNKSMSRDYREAVDNDDVVVCIFDDSSKSSKIILPIC